MTRVNVPYEQDGEQRTGWFDTKTATKYDELTRWDGHNNVSINVGSHRYQTLYRTAGGRWVLCNLSDWQGEDTTYQFLDGDTAKEWLIRNEIDDAVAEHFGAMEPESGPGGPMGGRALIVFGDDRLSRLTEHAERHGIKSRNELVRTIVDQFFTEQETPKEFLIEQRTAEGRWEDTGEGFDYRVRALQRCEELNDEVPDGMSWWEYRVVNLNGQVQQYDYETA